MRNTIARWCRRGVRRARTAATSLPADCLSEFPVAASSLSLLDAGSCLGCRNLIRETRPCPEMANHSRALDLHLDQEGVAIAVGADRNDLQPVARCLTLRPQFVAGSAEECDVASGHRAFKSF